MLISLFTSLSIWQLTRANQKKLLLARHTERMNHPPLTARNLAQLFQKQDLRFYRVTLHGEFDHQHTFLLDNRTFYGQIGYEIYSLFKAQGLSQPILVDRGFIPADTDRTKLPIIKEIRGTITITGMLNTPPTYVAFGDFYDSSIHTSPLRVEYIHLQKIAKLLSEEIYPYILIITPHHVAAYPIEWKIITMGPERHIGYALQWFAIALTLLIIWIALNRA
ncbi:MAG: hypothetical protein A3F42_08375 [Gammaproteobacteria bacterium RIFCSPHIGHO2_12_FULL_37_34]|nr:MAG: hypothetical protein A3F42_08375 [Gammaproteobacteria bacterium RIFCSPHIGHO2_12_FULL_37_34]